MLENVMYITGIDQVRSGNHQSQVRESPKENLLTSGIFGNLRKYKARFTENNIRHHKGQRSSKIYKT